ncbi:sensor domain-containing protein [Ktedonobacteria bacterium brp13]|nr:sensor domain-containing protein [Ktedonobacteria bacterium brp13]
MQQTQKTAGQLYQVQTAQTYINIGYLLLSFPLGILYFCFLIIGAVVSVLNLFIIGIPLMILFFICWWKLAAFERKIAIQWLGVDIAPMATPLPAGATRIQRMLLHLRHKVTWKSLLYLFLKFPFGNLAFYMVLIIFILVVVLGCITLVLSLLAAPIVLLCVTLGNGTFNKSSIGRYLWHSTTGWGLNLLPLTILNFITQLWGNFAQAMLGMNENTRRLAELQEIAERERARAERADQSRRELIMNVSHDLRTPVASIRGHLEALQHTCAENSTRLPDPETLNNYLTIAHRETLRLGALVEDLLSLAREDSQDLRVQIEAIDAGILVEEIYQSMMPLARRERQISILRTIPPQLPRIQADRQRLAQVLQNLVRNAITYTPDGGIIALSLTPVSNDYVILEVADTGVGIAPEEQSKIFERFYRIDVSRTRASGGFGLGLAIARDFVVAMGGTITVHSTPGEGSRFQIILKCA